MHGSLIFDVVHGDSQRPVVQLLHLIAILVIDSIDSCSICSMKLLNSCPVNFSEPGSPSHWFVFLQIRSIHYTGPVKSEPRNLDIERF
jgi:hypothetical protein